MDETELVNDGLFEMEDILNQAEVGRMALFDGTMPYIIPLNFLCARASARVAVLYGYGALCTNMSAIIFIS